MMTFNASNGITALFDLVQVPESLLGPRISETSCFYHFMTKSPPMTIAVFGLDLR